MGYPWIPPWIGIKSTTCARYDCSDYRCEDPVSGFPRRWCAKHAAEWDELQKAKGGEVITIDREGK